MKLYEMFGYTKEEYEDLCKQGLIKQPGEVKVFINPELYKQMKYKLMEQEKTIRNQEKVIAWLKQGIEERDATIAKQDRIIDALL